MKQWAYIALIFALLAFGYWYADQADKGGYNRAVAEHEKKENKKLEDQKKATDEEQRRNSRLSGQLAEAHRKIGEKAKLIQELRERYETDAQNGNLCNLTLGSVMLHNASLGYEYDSWQLADTGRALSTVTGAAFIGHCNGLATEFERQREQLNLLIESVKGGKR
jgi:hypothetical protein